MERLLDRKQLEVSVPRLDWIALERLLDKRQLEVPALDTLEQGTRKGDGKRPLERLLDRRQLEVHLRWCGCGGSLLVEGAARERWEEALVAGLEAAGVQERKGAPRSPPLMSRGVAATASGGRLGRSAGLQEGIGAP